MRQGSQETTPPAERVIFGTDPFARAQKNLYGNFLFVLKGAFPDPAVRKLILGGNIARLLGPDAWVKA